MIQHPISAEQARRLIDFNPLSGELKWKERTAEFCNPRILNSWNTCNAGKVISTVDSKGYFFTSIFGKQYRSHRLAWLIHYGEWPSVIDHINGIRTDNRIENLRSVTVQENHMNSRLNSKNTSGVCGVYYNRRRDFWCAQMKIHGKTYHIGSSKSFFEAVCLRKSEERRLGFSLRHGEKSDA